MYTIILSHLNLKKFKVSLSDHINEFCWTSTPVVLVVHKISQL